MVRELHFQREHPSQEGSAHQMDLTSLATDKVSKTTMLIAVLPRFDHDAASMQQAVILHRCCHLVVYNRSCSVPPTVPVHFYELGGTICQ